MNIKVLVASTFIANTYGTIIDATDQKLDPLDLELSRNIYLLSDMNGNKLVGDINVLFDKFTPPKAKKKLIASRKK